MPIQNDFLATPSQAARILPRAPQADAPQNHSSRRRVHNIPLAELKAGILVYAEFLYGASRDDLIKETARRFGFRRTGKDVAKRIGASVDQLVKEGHLVGDSDMLTVVDQREPTAATGIETESDGRSGHADPPVVHEYQVESVSDDTEDELFERYEVADVAHIAVGPDLRQDENFTKLCQLIAEAVDAEGPVHSDVLIERFRISHGIGRVGGIKRAMVRNAIEHVGLGRYLEDVGWLPEEVGGTANSEYLSRNYQTTESSSSTRAARRCAAPPPVAERYSTYISA